MTKIAFVSAALLALGLSAATPTAAGERIWVSGKGADAAGCGALAKPCRTFKYAHNAIRAHGMISVLDPADYGPVTITKSVSIVNAGAGTATVDAASGGAIIVRTASDADFVALEGLTIEGFGAANYGIVMAGRGTLNVTNCTVRDMAVNGIHLAPTSAGAVVIADTLVAHSGMTGLYANSSASGRMILTVSHSKFVNNGFTTSGHGVYITGTIGGSLAAMFDSTLIAQNGTGIELAGASSAVGAYIARSSLLGNQVSFSVGAGTSMELEKNAIIGSMANSSVNSGLVATFSDNGLADTVSGHVMFATPQQ